MLNNNLSISRREFSIAIEEMNWLEPTEWTHMLSHKIEQWCFTNKL